MDSGRVALVGSFTSGVDGSSEGGRISTARLPNTLVIYAVPLVNELRRRGYSGGLTVEPALADGIWVLKVVYEGKRPKSVPRRWHGHQVVVEKGKSVG